VSKPIIEVRNLSKRYHLGAIGTTSLREEFHRYWDRLRGVPHPDLQEFWALRDVSFEVQPGEVVGIIGRNGAGKSTLLKILSRITEPTSGSARLRGRVASLLEVGTGFHPELTGRENVYLNGAILGMTRTEVRKKFDEIVAFAEVEQFIDTPVKRYSSGMYVRLAFAVAAHLEPEILIIDEVLAVGDTGFQKKCIGKIDEVANRQGRTVIFVSHNLAAVKSLCGRALLLKDGRLIMDGRPDPVVRTYLHSDEKTIWEIAWKDPANAPGDGKVRLLGLQVVPENVDDSAHVLISSPLKIVVDFWNSEPGAVLNISLVLSTDDDQCVFNSWSAAVPTSAGAHRAVCSIPGNFLNDEIYVVRLLLVRDGSRAIIDQNRLLSFELHDVPRVGNWFGKIVGVVRPDLSWIVQPLEVAPPKP